MRKPAHGSPPSAADPSPPNPRPTDERCVYLMYVAYPHGPRWVMFDELHRIDGRSKDTRATMLARWMREIGPVVRLVRYSGCMRESEAVCTIASIRHPVKPGYEVAAGDLEKFRSAESEVPNG